MTHLLHIISARSLKKLLGMHPKISLDAAGIKELEYRYNESIHRMNLSRPDIAELINGQHLTCKIDDVRYWHDTIVLMNSVIKKQLSS